MICSKNDRTYTRIALFFQCVICKLRQPFKVISLTIYLLCSLGWEFVLGLMHYGDEWRKNRRTLHQKYRPDAALAHRPTQLAKVHELLRNLLVDPENFEHHYK